MKLVSWPIFFFLFLYPEREEAYPWPDRPASTPCWVDVMMVRGAGAVVSEQPLGEGERWLGRVEVAGGGGCDRRVEGGIGLGVLNADLFR